VLRESGRESRRLALIFSALFLFVVACPHLTLFSGQVIKQFETYSLAQSMAAVGWNPFATTIPCDGGIRWVLELPIFAGLGGIFVKFAPNWPSVLPTFIYGLFLFGLFRLRARLSPTGSLFAWTAVAAAPVFLRFATQFLPDPLAVALLLLGAGLFLEGRRAPSLLLFLLAVSVKPTVLPSVLFFRWAFTPERDARKILPAPLASWMVRETLIAFVLVGPFAAWSLAVKWLGIPSPMHEGGLLAVGQDWAILGTRAFYSKFFNWTVFKGVGFPLFLIALYGVFYARRSERILRLAAWSLGILPYWLLIRRLNVIHDYYSLSFFLPIALLGAVVADELMSEFPKSTVYLRVLLAVSILQGTVVFALPELQLRAARVADRPVFCGPEFRSPNLMGLPPVK